MHGNADMEQRKENDGAAQDRNKKESNESLFEDRMIALVPEMLIRDDYRVYVEKAEKQIF